MWSRFVNTSAVRGCNIPLDVHLEHLNKEIKNIIQGLGANKTKDGLIRCGKALGTISETLMQYDNDNNIAKCSGAHSKLGCQKELEAIIKELRKCRVFEYVDGRKHSTFPKPVSPLCAKPKQDVIDWTTEHMQK